MTDILLITLVISAPGALILGWLAFLNAVVGTNPSDLDELRHLNPRQDRYRPRVGPFPA